MRREVEDLTGRKFGNRVVLERAGRVYANAAWRVRCDCGRVDVVTGTRLRNGLGARCIACSQDDRVTACGQTRRPDRHPQAVHPDWTDEEIVLLRLMLSGGATPRAVTAMLPGRSRNAVIAKARREGVEIAGASARCPACRFNGREKLHERAY